MLVSIPQISAFECLNIGCRKGSPDNPLALVADVTTCRCHMESHHKVCIVPFFSNTGSQLTLVVISPGEVSKLGREEPIPVDAAQRCLETA